jgi:hypothetical protein
MRDPRVSRATAPTVIVLPDLAHGRLAELLTAVTGPVQPQELRVPAAPMPGTATLLFQAPAGPAVPAVGPPVAGSRCARDQRTTCCTSRTVRSVTR